jgi:hypothetical protein
MDDIETRHRIGRARLLRRTGKTYAEIRAVVGPVRDETLARWLRGIPRPRATYRSRALDEVRRTCRQLRAAGLTYGEIQERTGVSKASLSLWLRDLPTPCRSEQRQVENLRRIVGRGGAIQRQRALERRSVRVAGGAAKIGPIDARELFMLGLALYWAEGTKDKPWNRNGRVVIINSDPTVLSVFLSWLDLIGVPAAARSYRLSIHESAAVGPQELWWSDALDVPLAAFRRATLKRHNPASSRHNREETYHGCLTVMVARSRGLYDAIDGWWRASVAGAAEAASQVVPSGHVNPGSSNGRTTDFESVNGGSIPPPGARSVPWLPQAWWDGVGSSDG